MPKAYESMRDKFYQQKVRDWKQRHGKRSVPEKVRDKLYDNAQGKAARIYNSKNPGRPVGSGRD